MISQVISQGSEMIKNKTAKDIALVLSSLIFCFLAIEIGVRIFCRDNFKYLPHPKGLYENDRKRGYKLNRNFKGVFLDSENKYVAKAETNSFGFRDYEYGDKKENTFRILVLGDSFIFGAGVEMEDTYSKQLENILRSQSKKIKYEVINTGVLGYGTDQEYYLLEEWIDRLKPDLVIIGFYIENDVEDVMIGGLNHYTVKDGYLFDLYRHNKKEIKKNYFEKYSRAYEFIENRVNNLLTKIGLKNNSSGSLELPLDMKFYLKKYPPELEMATNKTKGFLKGIDFLAKRWRGKSLILLIPDKDQIWKGIWIEELRRYKENPDNYSMTRLNDELVNFAEENKIPLLDLLPFQREYEKKNDIFLPGDPHWNKEGHKFAAKTTYNFLLQKGLIQ